MKIVIAPDSYKDALNAKSVARAIHTGFRKIYPDAEYVLLPLADGGEGTLQTLMDATKGEFITCEVKNPLQQKIYSQFGFLGQKFGKKKTAVIEIAKASGLEMIPPHLRNPMITSTFGTGQLISKALDLGAQRIIIGLGGSATNDGGAGMMQALGARFLDANEQPLAHGGAALINLAYIDLTQLDTRLNQVEFIAASDVNNPLTGNLGASVVFGPQKGATPDMVTTLDRALTNYVKHVEQTVGRKISALAGAGAAGGMGAALLAFMKACLKSGIEIVMDAINLDSHCKNADLVITAEGRIDGQSIRGKTPVGVARIAKHYDLPVIAICGCLGDSAELVYDYGIDAIFPIVNRAVLLETALTNSEQNLIRTSRNIAKLLTLQINC